MYASNNIFSWTTIVKLQSETCDILANFRFVWGSFRVRRRKVDLQQIRRPSSVNRRMSYSCFKDVKGNSCGQEQVSLLTNNPPLIITYLRDIFRNIINVHHFSKKELPVFSYEGRHHLRGMFAVIPIQCSHHYHTQWRNWFT